MQPQSPQFRDNATYFEWKSGSDWFVFPGKLDISSETSFLHLPNGTDLQRGTTVSGRIRFNVDRQQFEATKDGVWSEVILAGVTTESASFIHLPTGNSIGNAPAGSIRFNSNTTTFEGTIDGVNWAPLNDQLTSNTIANIGAANAAASYWANVALAAAKNANTACSSARTSNTNAYNYMQNAATYAANAEASEDLANDYANSANIAQIASLTYSRNAQLSAQNAQTASNNANTASIGAASDASTASTAATQAVSSAAQALTSANNAENSEDNAQASSDSANIASLSASLLAGLAQASSDTANTACSSASISNTSAVLAANNANTACSSASISNTNAYLYSQIALNAANEANVTCSAVLYMYNTPKSTPQYYGAIGNGKSNPASNFFASNAALIAVYPFATSLSQEMDYLGWQAACNAGGFVNGGGPAYTYIMCNANSASNTPLTVISGNSWIDGRGCFLNYTNAVVQTGNLNFITDYDFSNTSSTVWKNATIYGSDITNFTFNTGVASYTDPPGFKGSFYNFGQMGQQITLSPGYYTATCTFTTTLGASFNYGNYNPAYCQLGFFSSSPGAGSNFCRRSANGKGLGAIFDGPVTQTIGYSFEVTSTTTTWLTFTCGGYGNFSISNMNIIQWIPNAGLVATRDGATQHYPIMQPIGGINMIGPGSTSGFIGVLYNTFINVDGNICGLADMAIDGFGIGLSLQSGAYLLDARNVEISGCGVGLSYLAGSQESGENNRFYEGMIFNNKIAIDNTGGSELTFYGTAIDYNLQAVVNNIGRIEFHGCHCEMYVPTSIGLPLFQCYNTGTIEFHGGMFLGSGGINTSPEPIFDLDGALSTIIFYGTELYNISSSLGVMASGAGKIIAYGWMNSGNANLNFPSYATSSDVYGGKGSFESAGQNSFLTATATDPSFIYLPGGLYPTSTTTMSNRWSTTNTTVFQMTRTTATTTTCTTDGITNTITNIASMSNVTIGQTAIGPNIANGSVVMSLPGSNTAVLSTPTIAAATGTSVIFGWSYTGIQQPVNVTTANGHANTTTLNGIITAQNVSVGMLAVCPAFSTSHTANLTNGSVILGNLSATGDLLVGMIITGNGIVANTTIQEFPYKVTMSANATGTAVNENITFTYSTTHVANTTNNSVLLTPIITSDLLIGMTVTGNNVTANTTIVGLAANSSTVVLSNAATGNATNATLTFNYTSVHSGNVNSGFSNIVSLSTTYDVFVGMGVSGNHIPTNTTVKSLFNSDTIIMSSAATSNALTETLSFSYSGIPIGTTILSFNDANSVVLSQPFVDSIVNLPVTFGSANYGSYSLACTRGSGAGNTSNDYLIVFAVPVQSGQNAWFQMQYMSLVANAGTLYTDIFWGQQIAVDTYGRPVFSNVNYYLGQGNPINITFPITSNASPVWSTWQAASAYTQYDYETTTTSQSQGAPSWATHMLITLGTESLPNNFTFYLDNIIAAVL